MSAGLTPAQAKALAFIEAYHAAHRHAPSYREIADHLGLVSKSGVNRLVVALEERGAIRRLSSRGRSIVPVRRGRPVVFGPGTLARLEAAARRERCTVDALVERAVVLFLAAADPARIEGRDVAAPVPLLPQDRLAPGSPADPARPGGR